MTNVSGPGRKGIINLAVPDKNALYIIYMPFIKGGGLFIQTSRRYVLGDDVFIVLTLMEEKLPFVGKVAWITPKGAHGNRMPGIGVQFASDPAAREVRNKIDAYLAGLVNSDRPTHTM